VCSTARRHGSHGHLQFGNYSSKVKPERRPKITRPVARGCYGTRLLSEEEVSPIRIEDGRIKAGKPKIRNRNLYSPLELRSRPRCAALGTIPNAGANLMGIPRPSSSALATALQFGRRSLEFGLSFH
jgi:hypothetical protein